MNCWKEPSGIQHARQIELLESIDVKPKISFHQDHFEVCLSDILWDL